MAAFCADIWAEIAPLRAAIDALPFNCELADGTLGQQRFQYYMVQDALYLDGYARALSLLAASSPSASDREFLAESARGAIVVERALHEGFFRQFGLDPNVAAATPASPTCTAYTSFLLATALGEGFGPGAAAVLPCFWIYREVGNRIAREAANDNPYQPWIDTYSDPDFSAATDRCIALVDRAAERAGDMERAAMRRALILSTRYEWMFWDAAWRQEDWPVQ